MVGTGFFGQTHAKTYMSLPSAELVAVVDVQRDRAQAVADEYGVAAYDSVEAMLERDDVDAVSVVTPEPLHREPAEQCARAGKHILLEKPIATTLEDAQAIITATNEAGVHLAVGFESRYGLGYSQLKEAIDGGTLGELTYVYAKRRSDSGFADMKQGRVSPIFEIAIHDIDMFLWFSDFEPITEVHTTSINKTVFEKWGQPDWQIITVKNAKGAVAVFDCGWGLPSKWAGWSSPPEWHPYADLRMEVMGSKGAAYADMHPMMVRACDEAEGWKFPDLVYWPNAGGVISGAIRAELESFVSGVMNDEPHLVTGEQAMQGLAVALMAEKSAETGTTVYAD